ncbi:uncharacterized protein [Parasteatoda tepidariorum]|uniref:uncharacterized protein n=1 Tax=Parasteatoda tepidariorum TaxID=114398 RepID=UPI000A2C0D7A|nr:uncharacterized protein LOC107444748 [Parasteatoda tepidariorum]
MYKTDSEFLSNNLKFAPHLSMEDSASEGVLMERVSNGREWLSHISASSRRRREALLIKQRKEKMRRKRMVKRIEYQRLRNMVPSIAAKPLVSKVTVIEEAIRYIDYLHAALLTRLRTKGLPSCLSGIDVDVNQLNLDDIKDLVCQLVEKNNQLKKQGKSNDSNRPTSQREIDCSSPVSIFERSRLIPSYLTAKRPMPKRT